MVAKPKPKSVTSIKEIAEIAGVSIATVSNTLNQKGRISEEVRKRVREICRKHGYQPNSAGRNLRRRLNESIGLLFYPSCAAAFRNIYYADILGFLSKALENARYNLVLPGLDGKNLVDQPPRFVSQGGVDGIILLGQFPKNVVRTINSYGIPLILIDNFRPRVRVDSVTTDGFGATRQIVDHLVSLGHRRIAFMAYEQDGHNASERQAGFEDGVKAHQLPPTLCPALRNFQETFGAYSELKKTLQRKLRPTAIVTVNDTLASEMQVRLKEDGYKIPADMSVFGFDDDLSQSAVPPISTVRVDRQKIAEIGAKLILERIASPEIPARNVVLPVELVTRKSIGPPAKAKVKNAK
ncbi:MAG: LacI family DNA-binding transcriptional regulator [Verrucomicrobiota bacterium]